MAMPQEQDSKQTSSGKRLRVLSYQSLSQTWTDRFAELDAEKERLRMAAQKSDSAPDKTTSWRQKISMNTVQRIILAMGILMVAISLLFPPWMYTFQSAGISQVTNPAGYYFVFSPPGVRYSSPFYGVRIDFLRLVIQTLSIAATGLSALVILRSLPRQLGRNSY